MDVSIPYTAGMLLGRGIDARTLKPGLMLPGSETSPTSSEVNLTTLQYSFVRTLKDVCDVLAVPPEYALKVEANIINNEVIYSCLKALDVKDSFTLIFRGTFLHKKQYLPYNLLPLKAKQNESTAEVLEDSGKPGIPSTESLLADATGEGGESQSSLFSHKDSHWVRAVEIGNEIILLVTLASSDPEKLDKMRTKWEICLKSFRGLLSQEVLQDMKKVATETDKKMSKKHYDDTKLDIGYGSFHTLRSYPNTMSGVVTALENFSDQCVGWKQMCSHGQVYSLEACVMNFRMGETVKGRSIWGDVKESVAHFVGRGQSEGSVEYQAESLDSDVDHDSFVVLATGEPRHFYPLKVTIQSLEGDESDADYNASLTSLAQSQYPESTNKLYEGLHRLLISCNKAAFKLQEFFSGPRFNQELNKLEGNRVLKSLQDTQLVVLDSVRQLDMITVPDVSTMEDIFSAQPLDTVNYYIEAVTTKLPPGGDLDLLLIGKTGHGKSSTGNSILGLKKFDCSADGNSVTSKSGVGWAEVDKRIIKVVDTPGVCDTNLSTTEDSIDLALRSISEAIAHCPEGFHALLLIIRFGTRMTDEEKKAIALLKCVLGEDVIKSHCICVITYGDNFESEMAENKTTFEQWCRSQSGFLKDLFKECEYRCVLFNNKASDAKAKKTQLINLVAKVDSLKGRGTRYTNSLFEFAKSERERIQKEEQVPAISEDMVRDLQLVLEYLNGMAQNTDETRYREELTELKGKVDSLSSRISEVDNGQLNNLVNSVFSLAETLHTRMEAIASNAPGNVTSTTNGAVGVTRQETPSPGTSPCTSFDQHYNTLQDCVDKDVKPKVDQVDEKVKTSVKQKMKDEGTSCFPGCSKVWLKDGHCVTLQHLKIGDQVLVRDAKGHLMYDTVYMFGHCDDEAYTHFVVLEMGERENVYVSSQHYVFCVRDGVELCMTAEEVRVGDELLRLVSQDSTALAAVRVQGKRVERLKGLFAPFTMEGTIVVDNHLMSCYVQCVSHNTAHLLLGPVRQLYKMSPNALATVNNLGHLQCEKSVPWWARVAFKALKG